MSAPVATAGVLGGDADEFEGLLDQFLDGGINYLSPLPFDIIRHVCWYLQPRDIRAVSRTCRRLCLAADSEDVWRKLTLNEFWSDANGKPPAQWKLYYRHWYSVKSFWKNKAGFSVMSFAYKLLEWSSFNHDLSGFMVCEMENFVRSTRYVNLRKAKSYTLREVNVTHVVPPMTTPVHAWSKHVFAVADNSEASDCVELLDIGEGSVIAPPPPLQPTPYGTNATVTALLWAGSVLVIGHHCGAIRAYNIIPHAQLHPCVPFRGYSPALPVLSLTLLEPGRIAALSTAGMRVFVAGENGFHLSQVIDVAPMALETFVPSGVRFVSYAGRIIQTWELSPLLRISETLDLSTLKDMPESIGVLAADEDSILLGAEDTLLHIRLRPLQPVRRMRFPNSRIVAISLDGPLAAVVYKHLCPGERGHTLRILNVYTGQVVHQMLSDSVRWVLLSGMELATLAPGVVQYWREGHVVPNKKMRVKQVASNLHMHNF